MSLSQALSAAVSGLRVTQSNLSVVAGNVANANTSGYVRKTGVQLTTVVGDAGIGVRSAGISRELDVFTQRQLRVESAGGSYASVKADFYARLQNIYGQPGSSLTLDSTFNQFTGALQALATSPDSNSTRTGVISAAQTLANQLNSMSANVQALRSDTEQGLADAINQANTAMQQIARINRQLAGAPSADASTTTLLDQRDNYLDQLATLMDIRVVPGDGNQVNVFTGSGTQLVGATAVTLSFDAKGSLTANSQWSADPSERSVGTISMTSLTGGSTDLIASGAFRSGKIAAYLEMRDQILPEAQAQLDQIASAMASALSDRTAVTSGPRSGFDADVGALLPGNSISVTYTDTLTNTQKTVKIVRVDDQSALPLPASSDPNEQVVGVSFANGMANVATQLNNLLGSTGLQFSSPGGTTLRVLDDGSPNRIDVNAVSTTATMTSATNGGLELPLFTDGTSGVFTGAITGSGGQTLGFASRIAVNLAIAADPSKLVQYASSTAVGDSTRPNFLLDQLTSSVRGYSADGGIGTANAPFKGTLSSYLNQVMTYQADAATAADSLKQGQDVVVNTLTQKFADGSSVNIDEEMTKLLNLQMAYGANARVMTTVRDLLDMLMKV